MTLEKKVINGKLNIKREGTIMSNLRDIRGISFGQYSTLGNNFKTTRVKYISSDEIPEQGKRWNEFTFYQALPFDIEGWKFEFGEVYEGEHEERIPIKQVLYAYLEYPNGKREKERRFRFP